MLEYTLNMYQTAGVAMLLFVLGRFLTNRVQFLKACCIPAPVVGGLIFALVHLGLYAAGVLALSFDSNVKDYFMTLFFTSVGYTACFRLLKVPVLYWVTADRYTLRIEPQLDWESIISTGSLPGSQAIATDSDITGQQRTIGFSDGKRSLADTPPQVNRRQAQKTEMMPF